MKKACVIGWPIEHSRSPLIHGYWLRLHNIAGSYTKIAVRPEELETFLRRGLQDQGLVGCNVTIPHKEAAFEIASVRDPSAAGVGAANTLWLEDGRLHAANTDTYGFMTHLSASAPGWADRDGPAVVLGAGGAARAIVYGLIQAGVAEVRIVNRTRATAEALVASQSSRADLRVMDWTQRNDACRGAALVINTTSLGMKGQGSPEIDVSAIHIDGVVADIVYVPLETPFLAEARRHGLRTVDGLGMLLHQAVPGFEKWFGVRPQVTAELRDIIVASIEDRRC